MRFCLLTGPWLCRVNMGTPKESVEGNEEESFAKDPGAAYV